MMDGQLQEEVLGNVRKLCEDLLTGSLRFHVQRIPQGQKYRVNRSALGGLQGVMIGHLGVFREVQSFPKVVPTA